MAHIGTTLRHMRDRFRRAGLATPGLDARLLVQAATGLDAAALAMAENTPMTDAQSRMLEGFCAARLGGMPVSKILGVKEFWGRAFRVNRDVLDPRPDSETLIEAALARLPRRSGLQLLDLGTGSGCLLLTLLAERQTAHGIGVDVSPAALRMARLNAHRLGVRQRAALRYGNWFYGVPGQFDMIVANPPYISAADMAGLSPEVRDHDPLSALAGGVDGLRAYRLICRKAAAYLKPHGWLVVEIGHQQAREVRALMAPDFADIEVLADLAGRDRIMCARPA